MKTSTSRTHRANQITAHNAGERYPFRFRGSRHRPGVCEFTSEVIRQGIF